MLSKLNLFEPERLLPQTLEDRLLRLMGRAGGYVLLAVVTLVWLSLVSWNVADPSLTHATGGQVRNMAGPVGAIISDLLLQTLGFASVVVLFAPMIWGLELVSSETVANFRSKIALYPVAVLLIAGALSAVPVADGWPLHHGVGGILGDVIYGFGAAVFGMLNPQRAGLAAGVLFGVSGCSAFANSAGLQMRDLWRVAKSAPYSLREAAGTWHVNLRAEAQRLATNIASRTSEPPMYRAPVPEVEPDGRVEPSFAPVGQPAPVSQATDVAPRPRLEIADTPVEEAAHTASWTPVPAPAIEPTVATVPAEPVAAVRAPVLDVEDDDAEFGPIEIDEDVESSAIARRFAPANARPAPEPHHTVRSAQNRLVQTATPKPASAPVAAIPALLKNLIAKDDRALAPKQPSLNLLKRATGARPAAEFTQTALRSTSRLLENVLGDFGVKGEVRDIKPGPVVTLYEFEPARGIKSSRIVALADDIARSMSATSVRVAVIPGRNAMGIELPNTRREPVLLREVLESDAYRNAPGVLPLALGKSIGGEVIVTDLARMPHLLIAGTTGSGKSVGVNAMILSLLFRHTPDNCRFIMIDPKMLELSVYNGIPHLLAPVVTDPQKAVAALNWVVAEMEERYKRMAKLSVRNIDVFNNRVRHAKKKGEVMARTVQTGFDRATGQAIYEREALDPEPMPYIVVVVDEFADLMVVAGKDIEGAIQRLAQMARAAGIHLIMATQRPSVDVVTGTIKANFPTRISFKVASKIDSRTILNEQGAEQLLGQGDMLCSTGNGQMLRVHGPFVSDEEVEAIAAYLRTQGEPDYVDGITETAPDRQAGQTLEARPGSEEDLYDRAVAIVLRDRKASTSYLQRRLGIGYNRAADLIERMDREGLISAANVTGKRNVLAGPPTV